MAHVLPNSIANTPTITPRPSNQSGNRRGEAHSALRRATMEFTQMKRLLVVLAAGVAAISLASCKHKPPANVAAEVNGHAITLAELDKAYQSNAQQTEGATEDQ